MAMQIPEKRSIRSSLDPLEAETVFLGDGEAECAALAQLAFHPDVFAVEFYQRLADYQS